MNKHTQKQLYLHIYISEFISTFILVFSGSTALVLLNDIGHLGVSLVHGMSLFVAQLIGQDISGGHANPAITFAAYLLQRISLLGMLCRIASQLSASIFAAVFMLLFFDYKDEYLGMPTVGPMVGVGGAIAYETTYSFILVLISLRTTSPLKPFACGMVLCIANANGTDISNGALNPARAFGAAIITGRVQELWIYIVSPLIATIFAAFIEIIFNFNFDLKNPLAHPKHPSNVTNETA